MLLNNFLCIFCQLKNHYSFKYKFILKIISLFRFTFSFQHSLYSFSFISLYILSNSSISIKSSFVYFFSKWENISLIFHLFRENYFVFFWTKQFINSLHLLMMRKIISNAVFLRSCCFWKFGFEKRHQKKYVINIKN